MKILLFLLLVATVGLAQNPASIVVNVQCGNPIGTIVKDNPSDQKIQSVQSEIEDCSKMRQIAQQFFQSNKWQEAYDTLKYFIENCTKFKEVHTYAAFSDMVVPNQERSTDPNRYPEHLAWLKKVLYYDVDTFYYCEDVYSMLETFYYFDSSHGHYEEGAMTVANYLLDSAKCGYLRETLTKGLKYDSSFFYQKWRDTVKDSIKTPFKLILPTLEDLDLTILRGNPNAATGEPAVKSKERIMSFSAAPNPFKDEIAFSADLTSSTMLHLDIFDELGRQMYSEGLGFKPQGEHGFGVQATGWARGVYYARLSTSGGEVRTVKLIKE